MNHRIGNGALVALALAFAGLLALFAAAVSHTRELTSRLASEPGAGAAKPRVALIAQARNNPFWLSIEQGARSASERYGMSLEYMGPTRIDPAEQTRLLEKAIAERFDALLVQGLNDPAYAGLIDQAVADGIPVLTLDADEPGSRRLAYVGTDNRAAGERLGEAVVRRVGENGELGVLIGSEASNQKLRLEGFRGVVARHPGLAIADVRTSNISRLQAEEQAEDLLLAHPGLKAIVGLSALDALGIAEAAERTGRGDTLLVFGFDEPGHTRREIAACRIAATLVQQPERMGAEAIALLEDAMQGRPVAEFHYTATTVLDRAALSAEERGGEAAGCG